MSTFYDLKVSDLQKITQESISVSLSIPEKLKSIFDFTPGQFVMVEKEIDGENLRRYYSIYAPKNCDSIKLGIKLKGEDGFADYAMHQLAVGDTLRVSPPMDDIAYDFNPDDEARYMAIAIGSGITPFYSIIQSMLQHEPKKKFVLVYGNHDVSRTMFYKELTQLQQQHPDRLHIHFVFSQDTSGDYKGRINSEVISEILDKEGTNFKKVFMIGPDEMKKELAEALQSKGVGKEKLSYRVYS